MESQVEGDEQNTGRFRNCHQLAALSVEFCVSHGEPPLPGPLAH